MRLIDALTDNAKQNIKLALEDGTRADLTLEFKANQSGWFYSLTYGDFVVLNRRLVNSPNMLRQFRGILSMGLACVVADGLEPVFLNDLISGRVQIFTLNSVDVISVEGLVANVDNR